MPKAHKTRAEIVQLYYIQNKGYCGNCLFWWKVDGHGYTTDLNEAWIVDRAKALDICSSRPNDDIPRSVTEMDAIARRHISSEDLK